MATAYSRNPVRAGIGLRLPHIAEVVATRPKTGWLEIHPENFIANPHAMELLVELSGDYPISVHTVGISTGSATGIDRTHLRRIRALVDRIDPFLVSGHLAWSTYQNDYMNDLLPLPFTREALDLVVAHTHQVQDALGRQYLIENPSSYVAFRSSTMSETDFLGELVHRTGCRVLCDVSNVHLSAHNMGQSTGYDAKRYIDSLPADWIGELHLGGFTPEDDESHPGSEVWIDTHAKPITDPAWELYSYALRRFGNKPTLIEWDNDIPPLATLLGEAERADKVAAASLEAQHAHTH